MRRPRYLNFSCSSCGVSGERLVETNDDDSPIEQQFCEQGVFFAGAGLIACGELLALCENQGTALPAPINKKNSDYKERERERLEKRSADHWRREGKDEAISRERALRDKYRKSGM